MLLKVRGHVTATGELRLDEPIPLPVGEAVEILIAPVVSEPAEVPNTPLTEAEITDAMRMFEPEEQLKSGAEVVNLLLSMGSGEWGFIKDSSEWLQEQRQKNFREKFEGRE